MGGGGGGGGGGFTRGAAMYAKLFERGGGGGCVQSAYDGGGGQSAYDGGGASPLQVRYTESGGGAVHFWHTENTLSLIIHGFANRYSITERA